MALFVVLFITLCFILITAVVGTANRRLPHLVGVHKTYARCSLISTLILVILIELKVRMSGGAHLDWLFIVHLCFAIPFLLSLVGLNYRFNGLRSNYHARIAYTCLVLFVGALATGVPFLKFLMA